MALESLVKLWGSARQTVQRFPVLIGLGSIAGIAGAISVDASDDAIARIALVAALGLSLTFAVTLFAERRRWTVLHRLGAQSAVVLGLVGFYAVWPGWVGAGQIRFVQLAVVFHLVAALLPYFGSQERNGFWQYNRVLFLRFLTAFVFSLVLFVGLVIALLAIDNLFGVDIDADNYFRLWLFIIFIFNPWFFAGGIPEDLTALDEETEYPVALRVFAQYVLTPIVASYLLILTAYLVRVLVTTTWPSGWIGYLVSSVATAGILAVLLLAPIREQASSRWVVTFSRWFYVGLMPSIVMLLLAIGKRIGQYGVTEKRYFVVVLAVWLLGIAVYHTVRKSADIKTIPATLLLVVAISAFGPWGAYRVSERSQVQRLEAILVQNGILAAGRIVAGASASFGDRQEISAILQYLIRTHGTRSLDPWFGARLAEIDTIGRRSWQTAERAKRVMSEMGLAYVSDWQTVDVETFSYTRGSRVGQVVPVAGYEYMIEVNWHMQLEAGDSSAVPAVRIEDATNTLWVLREGREIASLSIGEWLLELHASALASSASPWWSLPIEQMTLREETDEARLVFYVQSVNGQLADDSLSVTSATGQLFVGFK